MVVRGPAYWAPDGDFLHLPEIPFLPALEADLVVAGQQEFLFEGDGFQLTKACWALGVDRVDRYPAGAVNHYQMVWMISGGSLRAGVRHVGGG